LCREDGPVEASLWNLMRTYVVLSEIDSLFIKNFLIDSNPPLSWRQVMVIEYKYVQVWIIAKRREQSTVGWFLERLQKT